MISVHFFQFKTVLIIPYNRDKLLFTNEKLII